MTKIKELRDGFKKVDVQGVITEVSGERKVNLRTGGEARVADAMLKDDSGEISLTLWDDQIDKVSTGLTVKVENGYINSFRDDLKLNIGKFGSLSEVVKL